MTAVSGRKCTKNLDRTTVLVPTEWLDRIQALLPIARDWPQFEDSEPTQSEILRLAIKRGLPLLEAEAGIGLVNGGK